VVGRQNADIANSLQLRAVAMATIFLAFYVRGAYWRHLANTTQPVICGGDAALRQITLTTCSHRFRLAIWIRLYSNSGKEGKLKEKSAHGCDCSETIFVMILPSFNSVTSVNAVSTDITNAAMIIKFIWRLKR